MIKHSLPCYMLNPFRYQIETACECHSEKYHVTLSRPHPNRVRHFRCAGWYGDAIHIFFLGLFCVCISYIAGNWVPHIYTCNIGKHMTTLKYTVPFLYILAILQDNRTDCLNIVNIFGFSLPSYQKSKTQVVFPCFTRTLFFVYFCLSFIRLSTYLKKNNLFSSFIYRQGGFETIFVSWYSYHHDCFPRLLVISRV